MFEGEKANEKCSLPKPQSPLLSITGLAEDGVLSFGPMSARVLASFIIDTQRTHGGVLSKYTNSLPTTSPCV